NPVVGAVLVREGRVVGEGYHRLAGGPHAEVEALRRAGERARGATVYVTLEPCCHFGRTPPCTEALIRAGVQRVVAAMVDPDPRVRGRGLAALRAAGIRVEVGLLEEQARRLNEAYLAWHLLGRPLVTVKYAMTLDGRIATRLGDARWITGDVARRFVHRLRDRADVIAVGIGTVLADDPCLTTRLPRGGRDPIRLVIDSRARTPPEARVVRAAAVSDAPTWIAVTAEAPPQRVRTLEAAGAEVLRLPATAAGRVDLAALLAELGRRGVRHVLVEGGAAIHGALLAEGLADRVLAFIAPKLVGGAAAPGPVGGDGVERMAEALLVRRPRLRRLGDDWLIEGYLRDPADPSLDPSRAPAPLAP
ncbi:MAG: bifunctional diaminohydroxyphosphoribosylaminopyrimidine deaminase/5-amino-6-(5-phosphoribosylamino)uracil reductase RibD, partial [Bacillota bacterium]